VHPNGDASMALTCTLIPSAFTKPILDATIRPDGLELSLSSANVDDNSRGMLAGKFDVAEMSIGTYVQARSLGADLVALPIFPARRFMQPCILFAKGSGISAPADLRGKRIAFPQFWMTSSVWHRGIMEHEYGVPATSVEFITTQDERMEAAFTPGVSVKQIMNRPLPEFFTMFAELIENGSADVIFSPRYPDDAGGLVGLFSDPIASSLDYRKRTGVYPLMHTVVAKGSVAREYPGLARGMLALFTKGKNAAFAAGAKGLESPLALVSLDETRTLLGGDPFPFGVAPNRNAIDAFLQFAFEQGLSSRRLTVEEAFIDA
jgi:4,5-dihydroxyphthalate decarboxylase